MWSKMMRKRHKKAGRVFTYDVDTDQVSTSLDNMLDVLEKRAGMIRKYVWVVFEHGEVAWDLYNPSISVVSGERIHGVYTSKGAAEKKRDRVNLFSKGYFSVLKFRIKGQ
jgi:hypothetical protein